MIGKKINLNLAKTIIKTVKSIKFSEVGKKFILSIISLILLNSALSSVAMAAENPSEARGAFNYAAGCIAVDVENNPDIENRAILVKLQNLARANNTGKSLDSLDANSKNIDIDTFKWIYDQLGDLQQDYKSIVKNTTNAISNDTFEERGAALFLGLQDLGEEALEATDTKYQFKVTSMTTSTNPAENSFSSSQSPTFGGVENKLPSHWSK